MHNAPDITFPQASPELKVKRARPAGETDKSVPALRPEEQRTLAEMIADLQVREQNLRAYEAHLREWQEHLDAARAAGTPQRPSLHPFAPPAAFVLPREDAGLQAAWEKVHRARELLEAEQKHLVEDRLLLQEREEALKKREALLAAREARIVAREQATAPAAKLKAKKPASAMEALTRAPFAMAKSVFGAKG
jgi:hypothetical protein